MNPPSRFCCLSPDWEGYPLGDCVSQLDLKPQEVHPSSWLHSELLFAVALADHPHVWYPWKETMNMERRVMVQSITMGFVCTLLLVKVPLPSLLRGSQRNISCALPQLSVPPFHCTQISRQDFWKLLETYLPILPAESWLSFSFNASLPLFCDISEAHWWWEDVSIPSLRIAGLSISKLGKSWRILRQTSITMFTFSCFSFAGRSEYRWSLGKPVDCKVPGNGTVSRHWGIFLYALHLQVVS